MKSMKADIRNVLRTRWKHEYWKVGSVPQAHVKTSPQNKPLCPDAVDAKENDFMTCLCAAAFLSLQV